ncbi:MAG: hypothetical protein V2I51_16290 [Anderseniella sp.]|jgi:hypothetical protein|nr:hypothetical protein [Anderseniella sp.]
MNSFLQLIGINIHWSSYLPFTGTGDGGSGLLILLAMCLIGTTIINGVLKFDSLFNTMVNFCALFAGAYFANVLAHSYQLPGIDSTVMVAITANAGMAVAAIGLMIYYRTSVN